MFTQPQFTTVQTMGWWAGLFDWAESLLEIVKANRERQKLKNSLTALNDPVLRDIGLTRQDLGMLDGMAENPVTIRKLNSVRKLQSQSW